MLLSNSCHTHFTATEEIKPKCRQLILDHQAWCVTTTGEHHLQPCVHGNLVDIIPDGSFNAADPFQRRLQDINRAKLCRKQRLGLFKRSYHGSRFCYTHNRCCPIVGRDAVTPDYDCSGLPCPDWSAAGLRLKEEGVTSNVFIAHAKLHTKNKTPLLVIENVQDLS